MKRCSNGEVQSQSSDSSSIESYLKRCKVADRLSELPDDILVSVLSRIKLKEAIRTSILSRRWRSLWTFTTGALVFHYADPVSLDLLDLHISLDRRESNRLPLVERPEFIDWVNHVLSLHQGSTIDEFEVCAKLVGRIRKNIIDNWVEFALKKRVRRLKLDFTGRSRFGETNYSIRKPLLRKFSSHLDSLTILYLNKVAVSSKAMHYVLLKCCFLEELHLEQSSGLVELKVPGPMPQLRYLKIINCSKVKFIEIRAINILVFGYHGDNIPVTFGKAPRLVDAYVDGLYAAYLVRNINQFPSYISSVVSLDLGLSIFHLRNEVLPELPTFENLRNLKLLPGGFGIQSTLDCCASFLKKCPILRRFSLNASPRNGTSRVKDWRRIERSEECFHSFVNVLELEGFIWSEGLAEIFCSIVSCFPSLEQVFLRPISNGFYKQARLEKRVADVSKHLTMIMPARAKLIVTSVYNL